MSPTIFREGPFRFYFFSREESRMHVHVHATNGEAKFWLEPNIELAQNFGLGMRQVNTALRLIQEHEMKSAKLGKGTSLAEVTNVSKHGFWLLIGDKERFVAFEQFPWFRDAPIGHLLNVELPRPHHLHWPDLDVDIAVESIDHPERFPLVSKVRLNPPLQRPRRQASRR